MFDTDKVVEEALNKYKEDGLKETLKYLIAQCDKNELHDKFNSVLSGIYNLNNVNLEINPYWIRILDEIKSKLDYMHSLFQRNRGYKGEMPINDQLTFEHYERIANEDLTLLTNKIVEDISINKLSYDKSLYIFIPNLFEQKYEDRTVDGIYEQIYNYFDYRGVKLDDENNFRILINDILTNSKNSELVNQKISNLINQVDDYLKSKEKDIVLEKDRRAERIKKYYQEMENISKENEVLYTQISEIKSKIDENLLRKMFLTEEIRIEEGAQKK